MMGGIKMKTRERYYCSGQYLFVLMHCSNSYQYSNNDSAFDYHAQDEKIEQPSKDDYSPTKIVLMIGGK
jgi:hypothetical protein